MDSTQSAKMKSANGLQETRDSNQQAKHANSKTPSVSTPSEHQRLDRKTSYQTSSSRATLCMDAIPLPDRIQKVIQRKNVWKSPAQKKAAQKRKQDYANKVGWQKRHRHRHQHQADRERQFLNYKEGRSLDYDEDDENEYYR